jgi:hypothetical protein
MIESELLEALTKHIYYSADTLGRKSTRIAHAFQADRNDPKLLADVVEFDEAVTLALDSIFKSTDDLLSTLLPSPATGDLCRLIIALRSNLSLQCRAFEEMCVISGLAPKVEIGATAAE